MDQDLLNIAEMLESEAKRLRKKAFDNRPLPDFWRVGQTVRLLKDKEWCAGAGTLMTVVELDEFEEPAKNYQVFWTTPINGTGQYWTTPDEVELVEDV
jgi:hypothetical protein